MLSMTGRPRSLVGIRHRLGWEWGAGRYTGIGKEFHGTYGNALSLIFERTLCMAQGEKVSLTESICVLKEDSIEYLKSYRLLFSSRVVSFRGRTWTQE